MYSSENWKIRVADGRRPGIPVAGHSIGDLQPLIQELTPLKMKLENRTFIVSGRFIPFACHVFCAYISCSSSGLGLAAARSLYNSGAYVSLFDLNENEELKAELKNRAQFHKVDVSNTQDIESAVQETVSWCKTTKAPLGGVINCAGVGTAKKVSSSVMFSAKNIFKNNIHSCF